MTGQPFTPADAFELGYQRACDEADDERDLIAAYIDRQAHVIGLQLGYRHEELLIGELRRIADAIRRDEHHRLPYVQS